MPNGTAERGSAVRPPAAFGTTEYSVTSVFAASFNSFAGNQTIFTNHNSYRYFESTTSSQDFMGSVSIPAGVIVDYIGINDCDPVPGGGTFIYQLMDSTTGSNYAEIG